MLGLRLAIGAIALMAVMTAGAGVLALIGYENSEELTAIVLQTDGCDPYWQALVAGAQAAADDHGAELTVLQRCPLQHPHTGLLSIVGGQLRATCGASPGGDDCNIHVGLANYRAGKACADLAREILPRGGNVVALISDAKSESSRVKLEGFRDVIEQVISRANPKHPAIDLTVEKIAATSGDVVGDQLAEIAARHPAANLVIDFTGGSARVLQRSFRGDKGPQLITFDQSDEALDLIETGDVAAAIAHDPFQCGYVAVDRLISIHQGNPLTRPSQGKGFVFLTPRIVRPGDVAEFRASLKPDAASVL